MCGMRIAHGYAQHDQWEGTLSATQLGAKEASLFLSSLHLFPHMQGIDFVHLSKSPEEITCTIMTPTHCTYLDQDMMHLPPPDMLTNISLGNSKLWGYMITLSIAELKTIHWMIV